MTTTEIAERPKPMLGADIERVLISGDLSKLTPDQRLSYYNRVCESLGLNPLTNPFAFLTLNGKMVLYAKKDCTEQLRAIQGVSCSIPAREVTEGVYVVTARATRLDGRSDESIGAVPIDGLKGEARANAMMKAETKAKRRVTLSICGLGMLDEVEVDGIPGAVVQDSGIDAGSLPTERITEPAGPGKGIDSPHAAVKSPDWKHDLLKAFAGVKSDLKKLTGTDKRYYDVLGAHGYEKSDQIETREAGAVVYKALKATFEDVYAKVTQMGEKLPFEATDEDLPEILQGKEYPD